MSFLITDLLTPFSISGFQIPCTAGAASSAQLDESDFLDGSGANSN